MEFYSSSSNVPKAPAAAMWATDGSVQVPLAGMTMDTVKTTPFERRFNPYDFNGGTVVAIAGADFAVVGGCTRMSTGYEIMSRNQSKLFPLTQHAVLTAAGCNSDIITLRKVLDARLTQYKHSQGFEMSAPALAQLLGITLYHRRFFPYYAFCMVAGVDEEGKGAVFGYDAVGSFKRDEYGVMGSGQNFIMPILDNLIGHKNRLDEKKPLTEEDVVAIMKEVFIIATERDIYTGDNLQIKVIRKEGIRSETFPLKKD